MFGASCTALDWVPSRLKARCLSGQPDNVYLAQAGCQTKEQLCDPPVFALEINSTHLYRCSEADVNIFQTDLKPIWVCWVCRAQQASPSSTFYAIHSQRSIVLI